MTAPGSFTVAFIESDYDGNNCTNIIDINRIPGSIYILLLPQRTFNLVVILIEVVRGRLGGHVEGGFLAQRWAAQGLGTDAQGPRSEDPRLKSSCCLAVALHPLQVGEGRSDESVRKGRWAFPEDFSRLMECKTMGCPASSPEPHPSFAPSLFSGCFGKSPNPTLRSQLC